MADLGPDRRRHLGHGAGDQPARRPPGPLGRGGRARGAADAAGRVQLRLHGRGHAVRRPRPAGRAPAGARPARAGLGGRERDRRAGHRRRELRPRGRARRAARHRRGRAALDPVRQPRAQGLPVRVRLPGPAGHDHRRPQRLRRPGRRSAARWPGSTRSRPTSSSACPSPASRRRSATPRQSGIPYGAGPGEERVRRPDLHPAEPDHPPARHPAQAQPAARGRARQAGRRWSTTRSCAATRSGRRCGCCARRARSRCTCASRRRRCKWPCFYGIDFATRAELHRQRARRRGHPPLDRRRLARLRLAGRA